jgi:hypothetical protein
MTQLTISGLKPLRLTLERVGPFQGEPRTIDFFGAASENPADRVPANLFMLLAKNAYGKTTILESIYGLFGLMGAFPYGRFAKPGFAGAAQLDLAATWTFEGQSATVLLSIWTGRRRPLVSWDDPAAREDFAAVSAWARLGLFPSAGQTGFYDETDDLGMTFWRAVQQDLDQAPAGLFGATGEMPTVLFFPADRTLVAPEPTRAVQRPSIWGYQPAQCFGTDGPEWDTSIDNLLVWLDWLGDTRLEGLLEYVNTRVFQDRGKRLRTPDRDLLTSFISTPTGDHDLMALSHGERALLQLFVRTATHMTRNTILLIDELDTHLHSIWMNRMFQALKALAIGNERLTIMFSTHNRELLKVFDHTEYEPGLVKGGHLLEEELG